MSFRFSMCSPVTFYPGSAGRRHRMSSGPPALVPPTINLRGIQYSCLSLAIKYSVLSLCPNKQNSSLCVSHCTHHFSPYEKVRWSYLKSRIKVHLIIFIYKGLMLTFTVCTYLGYLFKQHQLKTIK